MSQWGAAPHNDVYAKLLVAYSEPHRRYHVVDHIDDCLAQLDAASPPASVPEEVELALWFHDAIYEPTSSKNEIRSADWATTFLRSAGAPDDKSARVSSYILATRHSAEPLSGDAALVVDVDLSILGRDREAFANYEQAIREEYRWVPKAIYRRKRVEILQSFLERPAIYLTDHFHALFERQARENLAWSIDQLRN
jgi:predicted metal-dependent HD superfamily phosphohydrolase